MDLGRSVRVAGTKVNTNTVEGFYSIFKRGMKGVYQHCGEKLLIFTVESYRRTAVSNVGKPLLWRRGS